MHIEGKKETSEKMFHWKVIVSLKSHYEQVNLFSYACPCPQYRFDLGKEGTSSDSAGLMISVSVIQ